TYLLVPPAPTGGPAPTSGTDRGPTWTVSDTDPTLTGYTCTVTGPGAGASVTCVGGNVVLNLTNQPAGTYTITITTDDNGVSSAPLTLTYQLTPPAPTGGPAPTSGTDRTPSWTITTADPTLTGYTCTVSGPGSGATVTCAGGNVVLNLAN